MQKPCVFMHMYSRRKKSLIVSLLQTFYVRDNGIDLAIVNAIEAIVTCLRSEDSYCVNVPDEGASLKSLGMS